MTIPPRLVLAVDGNSLVHRSFHALASTGMRSSDGSPIWAVRGLLTQLVAAVERIQPDAVIVGFDDPNLSIRRDLWPHYKATRTEKLFSLVEQLERAASTLRELGFGVVLPAGLEADDVLASVSRISAKAGARTVVMTSDRDAFALIDSSTSVLRIINGGVEASPVLTPDRLFSMLGVRPEQYRDFAALRGDPSDNLPGVRGIGPKTAAKLLGSLGSARAAFDDLMAGGSRVTAAIGAAASRRLADPASRAAWELNCQVMRFHDDLEIDLSEGERLGCLPLDADTVRGIFSDHQLPSTLPLALRALAHLDIAEHTEQFATASFQRYGHPESDGQSGARRGQRYSRLPKTTPLPKPLAEQLALFA